MTEPERPFSPEILSLFDERFLEHREEDRLRFEALRDDPTFPKKVRAIEIGCNRGEYLVGLAEAYPDETVIGFEWRGKYCRFARERIEKRGVTNAIVIHGDARFGLPFLFAPGTVGEVHVTFPDPWWRKRHAGRRVLEPMFMRMVARRLEVGGRLYLRSDVFDYLYRVRAFAEASEAFVPLPARLWPDETRWSLTTRERKCRDGGIPYGKGYYLRRADFPADIPLVQEDPNLFAIDEDVDPIVLIRGAPIVDKQAKDRGGFRHR
jgi:tRNA (guanine-N7-)-methyltransferase